MIAKKSALSTEAVIVNELGLHARSAGMIARIAGQARETVWISKDDHTADAGSIIDMLTLVSPMGSKLTVEVTNPADAGVLHAICRLFEKGFEE